MHRQYILAYEIISIKMKKNYSIFIHLIAKEKKKYKIYDKIKN